MTYQGDGLATRIKQFDSEHGPALRRIWLLGDVHGHFKHVAQALLNALDLRASQGHEFPGWLVFVGDLDLEFHSFSRILEPLWRNFPGIEVAFIHGNHDADTADHWERLHDCGRARRLHGQVLDMGGVQVAGLGGVFMGRVWRPPHEPRVRERRQLNAGSASAPKKRLQPSPALMAPIYPDEWEALSRQRADILVTHEAPSCHPHGFQAIDQLARAMGVVRSFHGHHHEDRTDEYRQHRERLGFDARALAFCAMKNGLGELVWEGDPEWS